MRSPINKLLLFFTANCKNQLDYNKVGGGGGG